MKNSEFMETIDLLLQNRHQLSPFSQIYWAAFLLAADDCVTTLLNKLLLIVIVQAPGSLKYKKKYNILNNFLKSSECDHRLWLDAILSLRSHEEFVRIVSYLNDSLFKAKVMGQQQGKQGVAAGYPPPMEGVASSAMLPSSKAPPVSRIKGLKPRQPKEGSWSPALSGTTMSPLGAGPPSGAAFGLFNELSSGKITLDTYLVGQFIFTM